MRSPASILVFAALALFAGEVRAHLDLLSPTPRTTSLKSGPCGAGPDDPRGPTMATFKPGETITVTWNEYVDHPGHFRIAFDEDGQDGFFDPKDFNDVSGGPGVLLDGIADKQGGDYSQKVQLPDIECEHCVLQVIQMMTDKPPYGDGNDLYYQCADIALVGVAGGTGGGESNSGSGETGDQPGTGESTDNESATGTGKSTVASSDPGTGSDATTDGEGKDSGCGCRSNDAGGLGWLVAGLMLLRRRRAA